MDFDHYKDPPVGMAVDLVNTLDAHSNREHLAEPGDAEQFLEERLGGDWRVDERQLAEIRDLRSLLRAVLRAETPEAAVTRLNALFAHVGAVPRMSLHDGTPHLHFEADDDSPVRRLGVVAAVGSGPGPTAGGLQVDDDEGDLVQRRSAGSSTSVWPPAKSAPKSAPRSPPRSPKLSWPAGVCSAGVQPDTGRDGRQQHRHPPRATPDARPPAHAEHGCRYPPLACAARTPTSGTREGEDGWTSSTSRLPGR